MARTNLELLTSDEAQAAMVELTAEELVGDNYPAYLRPTLETVSMTITLFAASEERTISDVTQQVGARFYQQMTEVYGIDPGKAGIAQEFIGKIGEAMNRSGAFDGTPIAG